MFFILRCVFWLSLVFAHLPAGESSSVSAGQFLDMAGRHVDALARQSLASAAAAGPVDLKATDAAAKWGAAWCKTHGDACAEAVLAAMRTKPSAASFRVDTLTAADRAVPAASGRTRS